MSEEPPADSPPPTAESSSNGDHRRGRVKVRKRIRVRTPEADRVMRREQWIRIRDFGIYAVIAIGGLVMIWIGLRVFVTDPGMPKPPG